MFEYSLHFAKFDKPDYILLKEALLAYEKIIISQIIRGASNDNKDNLINDNDKKYLFQLFNVVIHNFGTEDMEWFCATETILNTLFNIKSRNSPEYAKFFIQ